MLNHSLLNNSTIQNNTNAFNLNPNFLINSNNVDASLYTSYPFNKINTNYMITADSIYSGIDWIYYYIEQINAFDIQLWYLWFFLNASALYDNVFYKVLFFFVNENFSFLLYWSVLLGEFFFWKLFDFAGLSPWTLNYFSICGSGLLNHPELIYHNTSALKSYITESNVELDVFLKTFLTNETFHNLILLIVNFLLINIIFLIGILFYFSFFSSFTKEESTIDNDFMIASLTIEAEEEIACIDDILLTLIIVMYVFGWFFYMHCWIILTPMPELTLAFYLFPLLYYVILSIPLFLVYDFGIFFLAYLKGSSQLPLLLLELVYDYIALAAFYIRILVQGVRLILMIFTYFSLHEFILHYSVDQKWLFGSESILEDLYNLSPSTASFNYFILFNFFSKISYWLYELLHTFFVLTAQFIAFFAMIFWLFFFLYTFFISEKHEAYFDHKRKQRKLLITNLLNLKK